MLLNLLTGIPVMVLCLVLQAVLVTTNLRYYAHFTLTHENQQSQWRDILLLSIVMLLMLFSNLAQIFIWALLFILVGEFGDLTTAIYHSAVNFVTLGYGDIVMAERWRFLGPLEAINGILMFGVSTAVITAAVLDVVKRRMGKLQGAQRDP